MVLAREVAAVADPDRVRAGAELLAERHAVHVVRDGLLAHGGVGVGERAELVRMRLAGLVLEGVGVGGAEREAAFGGERAQRGGIVGLVPRDVQRDVGRDAHQAVDQVAVLDLLEHVARLAGPREAGEPRAAGGDAPRRDRHDERLRPRLDRADVETAAPELAPEMVVVVLQRLARAAPVIVDQRVPGDVHGLTSEPAPPDRRRHRYCGAPRVADASAT